MLQERKPFELLIDVNDDGLQEQSAQLRDFVRRGLIRNCPGYREAEEVPATSEVSADVAAAMAPTEPPRHIVVFDVDTMLRKKHFLKSAILAPASIAQFMRHAAQQSPTAHMNLLRELEESLVASDRVMVFKSQHLMSLLMLGARDPIKLSLPAIPSSKPSGAPIDLLLVNHLVDRKLFHTVAASIGARQSLSSDILDCCPGETENSAPPQAVANAAIHVHIGSDQGESASLRIVDSYARGKLVIHLQDPDAKLPEFHNDNSNTRVVHNVSGVRVGRVRDILPAARSLLADEAMAELFRRNGDRAVNSFNAAIEQRILAALL